MAMPKSLLEFSKDFLFVESLRHLDDKVFKSIDNLLIESEEDYDGSEDELEKLRDSVKDKPASEMNYVDFLFNPDRTKLKEYQSFHKYYQNDEELKLIKAWKEDPDSPKGQAILEDLVQKKTPFIFFIVGSFLRLHPDYINLKDELCSVALISLLKVYRNFDIDRAIKEGIIFNGYLKSSINGYLLNAVNTNRHASIDHKKGGVTVTSLDQKISSADGSGSDIAELVPDSTAVDPAEDFERKEQNLIMRTWIEELPNDMKKAIKMYYFVPAFGNRPSVQEIGNKLGMSRFAAQALLDRAAAILKKRANESGMREQDA